MTIPYFAVTKRALTCLFFVLSLLLGACEQGMHALVVGKSTLPQLLDEMGQPSMVWSEGDGTLQMEFSHVREGHGNFMARVSPTGVLISLQQVLTMDNADTLLTGMSQDQVRRHLGLPASVDKTSAGETWHWPLDATQPAEWQIDAHFGAKGTLTDVHRSRRQLGQSAGQSDWNAPTWLLSRAV